jgi:hypothetical protein
VQIKIDSQSGWRPNEDLKRSSAPRFRVSGGLIARVVAKLLPKKHFAYSKFGMAYRKNITYIFCFNFEVVFHLFTRFSGIWKNKIWGSTSVL